MSAHRSGLKSAKAIALWQRTYSAVKQQLDSAMRSPDLRGAMGQEQCYEITQLAAAAAWLDRREELKGAPRAVSVSDAGQLPLDLARSEA